VGVCQQITLVQFTDGPLPVSDIFVFTVSFKYIKFTSQKILAFIPEICTKVISHIVDEH
jgi:hypothetical protein